MRIAVLFVAVTACGGAAAPLQGISDGGADGGLPDAGDAGCIMPPPPVTCDAGIQGCADGGPPMPIGPDVCPPHPLPIVEVGQPFEFKLEAACGIPPYRWTISPSVPAGLEFNPDGTISGKPSVATDGSFVFTATVTDQTGATGSDEFSLQIVPYGSIAICDIPEGCPSLPVCGGDGGT